MADVTRRKPQETAPDLPLVKYLVSAGAGSRRHVVELVVDGKVRVNGERAESITLPVSSRDRVEVGGETVRAATAPPVYLLLNKPLGYLSTVHDDRGRPTVLDLVPQARRAPGLVPAGRLDLESSGLMLLTNDGDLVYRVTHPRYGVRKEYRVLLDSPVPTGTVTALLRGVQTPMGTATALAVRRVARDAAVPLYHVTLVEGKNREVRLMFRAVGRQVLELQRVRLGSLGLQGLRPGESRELTTIEVRRLRLDSRGQMGPPARGRSRSPGAARPPSRGAPSPSRGGPAASRGTPSPSWGGPPASRGAPSPSRGGPPASRGAPSPSRGGPPASRGAPSPSRGGPPASRGAPSPSRGGPPASRGAPSPSRGGPSTSRGAPSPSRGGPPASRSGPPPSRSGPPASRSGPPPSRSGPPASRSGPPASRSGPPPSRSGPPASRNGPPPSRSGPPASKGAPRSRRRSS